MNIEIDYIETSALTNSNIKDAFYSLSNSKLFILKLEIYFDYILKMEDEYEHELNLKSSGVSLTEHKDNKEKKECAC